MLENGECEKQRRKVIKWETLEVFYKEKKMTSDVGIEFSVEVKQPTFDDGTEGFPKMNATLYRDDRFLRFSCFDGDVSEIRMLSDLLNDVVAVFDSFPSRYDEHVRAHKKINNYDDEDDSQFSDAGVVELRKRKRTRNEKV